MSEIKRFAATIINADFVESMTYGNASGNEYISTRIKCNGDVKTGYIQRVADSSYKLQMTGISMYFDDLLATNDQITLTMNLVVVCTIYENKQEEQK